MKKVFALLLACFLLVPVLSNTASANSLKPDPSITVYLYGEEMQFEIAPIQTGGTTFVQFTTIFKELGINYTWDGPTRTVRGYNDVLDMELTLDDRFVILNDNLVELNVAPFAYNGRTLVPLRFVSEATGLNVEWNGKYREIYITGEASAPSSPAPSSANIDALTHGTYDGDSESMVKALTKLTNATKPYGDAYLVYNNYDLFGYNSELSFAFIYDELVSVSYMFGKTGAKLTDDDFIVTIADITEEVSNLIGEPDSEKIYETIMYEGQDLVEVDEDQPYQLILNGLSEGDYAMEVVWELIDHNVVLFTYQDDNGRNIISLDISFN